MAAAARRGANRRTRARRHRLRRWTAGLLAGLAAFAAVSVLAPPGPASAGEPTLVALRDIPAGAEVTRSDLVLADRPDALRPLTALTAYEPALGKVAAVPIPANDVITPEVLRGAGLLEGQPAGHVALTLPVAHVDGLALAAGDHVDVYASGTGDRVATDAVVLTGPSASGDSFGGGGVTVSLALPPEAVVAAARATGGLGADQKFIIALRRSGGRPH